MSAHTPGPWKVREDYAGAMSVVSYDSFLARVGPPNTKQATTNARLMAASPDLLEALQMVLEDAAFVRVGSDLYTIDSGTLATVAAAIRKATEVAA